MTIQALKKSKILEAVRRLTQKKKEEVYLVGGTVRDFLLRKPLGRDFDFVTQGDAEGLAKELAGEVGGHAFPLDETFGTWRVVLKKKRRKRSSISPASRARISSKTSGRGISRSTPSRSICKTWPAQAGRASSILWTA